MSVEVDISYQGELRCEATHQPSGSKLVTDAPVDNHGKGEAFSPTDLVATALGSCMLTIMGIVAQRNNWDLNGTTVHVVKEMAAKPARRIGKLEVTITIPAAMSSKLTDEDRQKIETAAHTCPVQHSLHPEVEKVVKFVYAS